jgi:hypothetical protein
VAFFSSASRSIGVTLPVPWQASQSFVLPEAGRARDRGPAR